MKRTIIILTVFTMLATSSCAVRSDVDDNSVTTDPTPAVTQGSETTLADEEISFHKTDEETFTIETPYGNLHYPTKWKDAVSIDTSAEGSTFTVSFLAVFDWKKVPLYSIVFGQCENGYLLGTIKNGAETVSIYLIDRSCEYDDSLEDSDESSYLQMCEDVNVIISKLVYESGMVLPE